MKRIFFLTTILFLAAFLRFYKLPSIPNGFSWDEAAISYNAWSIAETGRDEHNQFFPIAFRSFNDYKAPGLIYLLAGLIKIFGPQTFLIRYAIAVIGVLTVLVTYFLVKELFPPRHSGKQSASRIRFWASQNDKLALITSLLLAISPWHLIFSRPGFEASLGLFFNIIGILFLFKFINSKKASYLFPSGIAFIISLYSYHSPKIFLPLFLLSIFIIYFKKFTSISPKKIILLIASCLLLISPLIISFLGQGNQRFFATSIFGQHLSQTASQIQQTSTAPYLIKKILYNRPFLASKILLGNYLKHFSPRFWLTGNFTGWRTSFIDKGMIFPILFPFFVLGFFVFIKRRQNFKFIFAWFLLAFIPAIFGTEVPHSLRTILVLPLPSLFIAFGIIRLSRIKLGTVFFITISLVFFLYYYFATLPQKTPLDWLYGHQEMVNYVTQLDKTQIQRIKITDVYQQPYIFFLWFNKIPPEQYQARGLSNYDFGHINPEDFQKPNQIIVGSENEIPTDQPGIIKEIISPDGHLIFRIVET